MKRLLILFLFTNAICFSQQEKFKQLDSLFDLLSSNHKIMGSLSVMVDGKIVYSNTIGYQYKTANEQKEATKNSKYRIGSVTKTFTASMIFQLLDEKKISLEDKLSEYFPEIPNATKISIANLLNHSSGLYNITQEPNFSTWMLQPTTHEQMLSKIKNHDVVFQPGEKNEYSNTNFILLGYILEKIEDKPYKDILKECIVDKLNLKNTYYGGVINIDSGECQSYYYNGNNLKPATETNMSNPAGAGAIVSTSSDLVVFIDALFNGKLISSKSLERMTKLTNGVASGLMSLERDGQIIYGHGGGIDGFQSFLIYVPKSKTAIAVTSNASSYGVQPIVFHALDNANGKTFSMPNFNRIQLSEQQVKAYEGVYESKELPFDLTFVADGKTLKAGPDSNHLNSLEATKKDEFVLEAMGVTIKFDLENNTLLFDDQTTEPKKFTKKQ